MNFKHRIMKMYFVLLALPVMIMTGCNSDKAGKETAPVEMIALNKVKIDDQFWNPRIENNMKVSIPEMLDKYEEMERAPDPKLVEAVGYLLQTNPDSALQARMDIDNEKLIGRVLPNGKPRAWKQLLNGEMYSAGHFMEAAVAYYDATGNRRMLDAAIVIADDIDTHFGPGKRLDVSQHEELKIGLLKLYHSTGDEKYLNLSKFFMDERGHSHNGRELYGEYAQDHMPVVEQPEAVGHTVRATYLYTPLAELASITGDVSYKAASDRLWEDAVYRKTFITGSIGSYRDHEDYGEAWELPNISCWNETCASIGNVFWNYQMFSLHRDAKYIDVLENVLYNGFLSGVSLDGSKYFYQNPLKTFGGFERQPWFGPNCCPPNIVRLLASLGKYIYAVDENSFYVNLFIGSSIEASINNTPVTISQKTGYPWEGNVRIMVAPEEAARFTINVRIPGWTASTPLPGDLYAFNDQQKPAVTLKLNGSDIEIQPVNGYAPITRTWKDGDILELNMEMPVRKVISNGKVLENAGMVALQRGPLVYCAEEADNTDGVMNLYIPENSVLDTEYQEDILGGIVVVKGTAIRVSRGDDEVSVMRAESPLVAVPYYSWANRTEGEMSVWMPASEERVLIPPVPSIASTSRVTSSCGTGSLEDNYPGGSVPDIATRFYPRAQSGSAGFSALYDQVTPVSSFDGSSTYLSLRPQSGNDAWVQYDFSKAEKIGSVDVYWKDDKQICLAPESWQLLYKSGTSWLPVENPSGYAVEKDKFNTVTFEPVTTDGLRLVIKLSGQTFRKGELGPPDGNYMPEETIWYETGIIEWRVNPSGTTIQ